MRSYEDSAFCSRIALLQQYVISWSIWMAPGQTGQDLDVYTPLVSSVCCHCAAVEGSTVSPLIHVNQAQDWPDFVMSNAKQHCIDNFCQDTLSDRNLSPPSLQCWERWTNLSGICEGALVFALIFLGPLFFSFLPGSDFGMISRKRYFVWPRVISSNLLVKSQRVVVPMKSTMRKNPPILLRYFQVSCQSQVKPASIEHVFPPHGSIYLCEKCKQFPCTRPLQQLHCEIPQKNAQPYLTSVSCAAGKKQECSNTCSIIVCGLFVIV